MKGICARLFQFAGAAILICGSGSTFGAEPVDGVQFKITGPAALIKAFQEKLQAQHADLLDPETGQCAHGKGKGKPASYVYVCKRTPEVLSAFSTSLMDAAAPSSSTKSLTAKSAAAGTSQLQMGVQAMALLSCANTHCVADGFTPCTAMLIAGNYICYHRQVFPTPGHNCVL